MNALAWLTQTKAQAVRSVQPLHGLTACSQLIELENGERYVWRKQSRRATDYGINYSQEAVILAAIAEFGFSPVPCYVSSQETLLHWLEGEQPKQFDDQLLQQLAALLAKLHRLDLQAVFFGKKLAKLDLAEHCYTLWKTLSSNQQAELGFSPPFNRVEPFAAALCHHDIHLANLVTRSNRLFLIDWEYAAVSDPALELAMIIHGNALTSAQQAVFLNGYFAKNPLNRTACIAKMKEYLPEIEKLNRLWFAL